MCADPGARLPPESPKSNVGRDQEGKEQDSTKRTEKKLERIRASGILEELLLRYILDR